MSKLIFAEKAWEDYLYRQKNAQTVEFCKEKEIMMINTILNYFFNFY